MNRLAITLLACGLLLSACQPDLREQRLDHLQVTLDADRARLQHEVETADPARPDLKATFLDSSIMQFRATSNPARPWVAYVRIKWHFAHADGRQIGDSIYDYIYALDPQEHWMKADDEPVAPHKEG